MEQHFSSPQRRSKSYLNFYVSIIGLVAVFGLGVFVGQGKFQLKADAAADSAAANTGLTFTKEIQKEQVKEGTKRKIDFDLFWSVWENVQSRHVSEDIKDVDLFYGAVGGMVKSLNDPYSVFFPPKEATQFVESLRGSFSGIGAEVGMKENVVTIIAPLPDSPAEKAGIKAGDRVLKIDGKETTDMDLDTAIQNIRGEKGTTVVLTISNNDFSNIRDVSIVRDVIRIPSIKWADQDGVAYLQMYNFNEESLTQFKKAVEEISAKKMKGIVLDLRNNPGGFLEIAVQAASEWLKDGDIVVKERDNQNKEQVFYAEGPHRFQNIPTVILVNEGSASASEILAGALQDYGKAVLVGKKTYGKGSVQDLSELPDGSALKLTIAEWLTPKERHINNNGIEPDVAVDPLWEAKGSEVVDHGLEKAKEVLKQLQKGTFVKPEPVKTVEKK